MTDFAFITHGGVYVITDGRYAKATQFRRSRVPADLSRLEMVASLRVLREGAAKWLDAQACDVRAGDVLWLSGRDYWALTTEIMAVFSGIETPAEIPPVACGEDTVLLLWSDQAWLLEKGTASRLLEGGNRSPLMPVASVPETPLFVLAIPR